MFYHLRNDTDAVGEEGFTICLWFVRWLLSGSLMVYKCCCRCCYCFYIAVVWEVCVRASAWLTCACVSPTFFKIKAFFKGMPKSLSLLLPLKTPVLWVWQLRRIDFHCYKVFTQVITRVSDEMGSYSPSNTPACQNIRLQWRNFVVFSHKQNLNSLLKNPQKQSTKAMCVKMNVSQPILRIQECPRTAQSVLMNIHKFFRELETGEITFNISNLFFATLWQWNGTWLYCTNCFWAQY